MDPPVLLYNIGLSESDLDELMKEIRSSSYIDEVESGEGPREESPLYNEIVPAKEVPKDTSIDSLLKHAGNPAVLAIADNRKGSILIVETDSHGKKNQLRVSLRDAIEVCCNCRIANMDLEEVRMRNRMGLGSLLMTITNIIQPYSSNPWPKRQVAMFMTQSDEIGVKI